MIAILGCGPAGMLVAHACALAGEEFRIYSIRRKAIVPGAMYLHTHIPEVTPRVPQMAVQIRHEGSREVYASKVYGDASAPVSWDHYASDSYVAGWSLYEAYERLWERYEHHIRDERVGPMEVGSIPDPVISTIPLEAICYDRSHSFERAEYWVLPDAAPGCPPDTIIYNGEPLTHWHRTSRIGDWEFTESKTPMLGASKGWKPIATDCDCFPQVLRAGRFGAWDKNVLLHHVFEGTREHLEARRALL